MQFIMTICKNVNCLTSSWFIFNRLFEKCDVSEGTEEKHHLVIFISDWSDLHVKPYWCSCRKQFKWELKERTNGRRRQIGVNVNVKNSLLITHLMITVVKTRNSILTILCIEQHLIEIGLIVIKGPSDFVYSLLISQVTVHEAAK